MTSQTRPLRDRIVEVLWPLTDWDGDQLNAEAAADAVLAVLPEPADRAAVLREAADDIAVAFGDPTAKHIGAIAASWLRRRAREMEAGKAELRRLADEAQQPTVHRPQRGDQFEAWLKAQRDSFGWQGANDRRLYDAFDNALDNYRLHADTGTPLGEHVCEGRVTGDCECLEQPAAGARQDGAQR